MHKNMTPESYQRQCVSYLYFRNFDYIQVIIVQVNIQFFQISSRRLRSPSGVIVAELSFYTLAHSLSYF